MAKAYKAIAGTATAELTILQKDGKFVPKPLNGCFVKRDANLKAFIEKKSFITDHNKYESCKYLFYSYPVKEFQGSVTKAVIRYRKISKDKKSDEPELTLNNEPLVIRFNGHFFLCCDFKDIGNKRSVFPKKNPNASTEFLQNHSTEFKMGINLHSDHEIYGLGWEKESGLRFFSLDVTQCQSEGSNIYRIKNEPTRGIFDKLNKAGPLVLWKEGDKTKYLVGCYHKKSNDGTGNSRIKIDMFREGHGDPPEPEERRAATLNSPPDHPEGPDSLPLDHPEGPHSPPPNHPEGPDSPPPNHPEGPDSPPPNHPEGSDSPPPNQQPEGSDSLPLDHPEGSPIPDNTDGIPFANEQQVYLQEFFQKDAENMKTLARFLDRRSIVLKNYEHLADLLKAPPLIKAKCKSNSVHSPTLDLLQMSKVSGLSVNDLIGKLRQIPRNDVANEIESQNGIPEDQRQSLTVKKALNDHWELFEKVATDLDNTKVNNWRTFGGKLGFKKDVLDQIELGCNPTERLLEDYAYPTLSADELTVRRFKELVVKIEGHDILELLRESGITEEDNTRSIVDVIPPQSELMWKLCLKLNKESPGSKNWKHLAAEWKIPYEIYSQFKPIQKSSPTELLLNEWLIGERPDYTVNALCYLLGQIQRNDAKEFLEKKLRDYS